MSYTSQLELHSSVTIMTPSHNNATHLFVSEKFQDAQFL